MVCFHKHLDNYIDMIDFLGRVVGKALYEGILLDYSFS
jgi:ubiquitin-protein ligase E3 B